MQYLDTVAARARHEQVLYDKTKQAALVIDSGEDTRRFGSAASVRVFYEDPLPYENYHVGVSYSLIFGVSLNEYTVANEGVLVP